MRMKQPKEIWIRDAMAAAEKRGQKCCAGLSALTVALSAVLLGGCSGPNVQTNEKFIADWQRQAAQSPAYSPSEEDLKPEPRTMLYRLPQGVVSQERQLPTVPVTFKLRDAPVASVLRSMSRAANISLVISPAVSGTVSLDVTNERWDDVFESVLASAGLHWQWQGKLLQVLTAEEEQRRLNLVQLQNQFNEQRIQAEHSGLPVVSIVKVRYSEATDLKKSLEKFLTRNKDAVIEIDEHNNALIVQATEAEQKRVIALVNSLDRPRAQVQLKAYIVETTKEMARELGTQWGGTTKFGGTRNQTFIGTGSTAGDANGLITEGGQTLTNVPMGFNYNSQANITSTTANLGVAFGKIGASVLEAQLTMMESEGVLNILSSPSIITLDNKMAYTENGERVPYVSTNGDGDNNVQFEDAVLRLEMTPNVIDRNNMKLHVLIKKDEVDTSRAVEGNPYIIKKQTQTTVLVRSGDTIVISGLTKERQNTTSAGIPGLRELPGGRALFGADNRSQSFEEVLIFITPVILPTRAEAGVQQRPPVKLSEKALKPIERDANGIAKKRTSRVAREATGATGVSSERPMNSGAASEVSETADSTAPGQIRRQIGGRR